VKRVSDECAAPRACAQRAHPHPAAQSPVCASLLRRTRPLEPRNHFTDCSTSPRLPESVPCTHIALKSGRFVVQGFCKALYSPTDLSNLHPRCAAPRTLTPARTVHPLLPPDMHGPSRSRIGPVRRRANRRAPHTRPESTFWASSSILEYPPFSACPRFTWESSGQAFHDTDQEPMQRTRLIL